MSDVKEMLRSALGETRSSGGDLERTMKRAESRERTRRVFTALLAFVVFAGAGTALWYTFRPATQAPTPGQSTQVLEPTPTPLHQGWISYSDPKQGFSVDYPPDWTRAQENLTPHLSDPHEILSLGTYPLRPGGANCAQFPTNAIQDLGPGDALVSLQERTPPDLSHGSDYQARPAHFGPTDGTKNDESPGCLDGPKTFEHHWIPFADQGRTFYAYIAMGADISAERRAQVWDVLDSLRFQPAGFSPPPKNESSSSPLPVRDPAATATVKVSDFPKEAPNSPAAGVGSIWTGVQRNGAGDFVARIDTSTNEVVARIPVNQAPWDIAVGAGSVWVTTYGDSGASTGPGDVQRIDPATNAVIATIQVDASGHPGAIAASEQAVWVDIGNPQARRLVRIDPATNQVAQTLPLPGASNAYVADMQEAGGDLWVSRSRGADLLHIDAVTGEIVGSISGETLAVAGPEGVWVQGQDGGGGTNGSLVVRQVDPATDAVEGDPIHIPDGYGTLLVDSSGVWLDGYDSHEHVQIIHVDATTGKVDAMSKPIDSYYTGAVFDRATGSFWVTAPLGSFTRFDIP